MLEKLPKKILIVGSGTGNDVAAANRFNIQKIDAVEIDPVIANIGKKYHTEHPYQNNNGNFNADINISNSKFINCGIGVAFKNDAWYQGETTNYYIDKTVFRLN